MSSREEGFEAVAHSSRGLQVAQVAWLIAGALSVAILIASIPGYLFSPTLGVFDGHLILEPGSPQFYLTRATHLASFLSASGAISLAVFLYIKNRADVMSLFLSYYLLGLGILFAGPIEMLYPYWENAAWVNSFLLLPLFAGPMTAALVAIFPDGHFVPSWSRWLIPFSFLSIPASFLSGSGSLPFDSGSIEGPNNFLVATFVLVSVVILIAGIYIQVFRYRYVSSPWERLQAKWVLYGIGLWAAVGGLSSAGWTTALQLPAGSPVPIWLPLASLVWVSSALILPVTLTISITRYRLFDIDLLINRTILYSALTVGVIVTYILVVSVLGILFQTQGNLLVALLATSVVAVAFQPMKDWLQKGVNRLIFGERDDPIEALSRLGNRLESSLAPDMVLATLVETIAHTLKLPYVAITVEEDRIAAAFGKPFPEPVGLSLTYQGDDIGQLLVSPRSAGMPFSKSEMRLLRNIARQAGAAIRAAQLTDDLRRSRQQIVTAREEERRRLRRDLHDGIGPTMAGQTLKLDAVLDLLSAAAETRSAPELAEASQLIASLKDQTRQSIESIRRIVYGLRPPALDDLGLIPAIEAHVDQHAGVIKTLQVAVEAPGDSFQHLPAAVEAASYHIVLDALTNVIQHARAQHCRIRLSTFNNPRPHIRIEITDDGIGLPENFESGVGMASMRERATELGGSLSISAMVPSGTRVRAEIPLEV